KALVVAGLEELALHPGRADFEGVLAARNYIFDIEDGSDMVRHQFAICVGDSLRFIDRDSHEAMRAAALDFDLDEFEALGPGHSLRDLFDFGRHWFPHTTNCAKSNKKVGFRPLRWFDVQFVLYRVCVGRGRAERKGRSLTVAARLH